MRWKRIYGFPDYEISDTGLVRSYRKHIDGRRYNLPCPRSMKASRHPKGYLFVGLMPPEGGKVKLKTIHRLVAENFLPNHQNLSDVAHNDGIPFHNDYKNLRWATHSENQLDMRKHKTMQDGEKCVTAKLKESEVLEIIRYHRENGRGSGKVLANKFNVTTALISKIVRGHSWKYINR